MSCNTLIQAYDMVCRVSACCDTSSLVWCRREGCIRTCLLQGVWPNIYIYISVVKPLILNISCNIKSWQAQCRQARSKSQTCCLVLLSAMTSLMSVVKLRQQPSQFHSSRQVKMRCHTRMWSACDMGFCQRTAVIKFNQLPFLVHLTCMCSAAAFVATKCLGI